MKWEKRDSRAATSRALSGEFSGSITESASPGSLPRTRACWAAPRTSRTPLSRACTRAAGPRRRRMRRRGRRGGELERSDASEICWQTCCWSALQSRRRRITVKTASPVNRGGRAAACTPPPVVAAGSAAHRWKAAQKLRRRWRRASKCATAASTRTTTSSSVATAQAAAWPPRAVSTSLSPTFLLGAGVGCAAMWLIVRFSSGLFTAPPPAHPLSPLDDHPAHTHRPNHQGGYHAIIIPAGGQGESAPPPHVLARLQRAAQCTSLASAEAVHHHDGVGHAAQAVPARRGGLRAPRGRRQRAVARRRRRAA